MIHFEQLYLDEGGVRVVLAEPFKTLFGPEVMQLAGRQGELGDTDGGTPPPENSPCAGSAARTDWGAAFGAPGRIRTCATASGGRCSIP